MYIESKNMFLREGPPALVVDECDLAVNGLDSRRKTNKTTCRRISRCIYKTKSSKRRTKSAREM